MAGNKGVEGLDKFIGKLRKHGGSLSVVIPNRNVLFSGLNAGDLVHIYYKYVDIVREKKVSENGLDKGLKEVKEDEQTTNINKKE